MKELYIHCDSPCWSCPSYGRIRKISSFKDRKIDGAYYCPHCDTYSLCKMGIANRRDLRANELRAVCTKCNRFLEKITLSYSEGQGEKPFTTNSILVIRKPNGSKYNIIQSLKASYFDDLAEILLYILSEIGSGYYNLVEYNPLTNTFKSIYTGFLKPNEIIIRNAPEERVFPSVQIEE